MKKTLILMLSIFAILNLTAQITEEQKEEILNQHNYYRQLQGAANLVWSDKLQSEAQQWANYIAKKDIMAHSKMEYGENIYMSTANVSAKRPVDAWASEEQYYNGETISHQNYTLFGHYTQLIWSETTQVGCAYAISKTGKYYWVCEYYPSGNFIGQKPVKNYQKNK